MTRTQGTTTWRLFPLFANPQRHDGVQKHQRRVEYRLHDRGFFCAGEKENCSKCCHLRYLSYTTRQAPADDCKVLLTAAVLI